MAPPGITEFFLQEFKSNICLGNNHTFCFGDSNPQNINSTPLNIYAVNEVKDHQGAQFFYRPRKNIVGYLGLAPDNTANPLSFME